MDYQRILNTFISGPQILIHNFLKICRRLLRSILRFAAWTCRINLLANVAPRYFVEVTPPDSEFPSVNFNDDEANLGKCKESKSFTSVLDRLELDAELEARNEIPLRRTNDAQTEPSDDVEQELYSVNARDVLPCRQVLHHRDILYFQVRHPTIQMHIALSCCQIFRALGIHQKISLLSGRRIRECGFGNRPDSCEKETSL